MQTKIVIFLLIFILFSTTLADVRFFPNRSGMHSQHQYQIPSAFDSEKAKDDILSRRLQVETNYTAQPITMRLNGDTSLGYYYVTMFFGTPIQKQTLIVDTGSMTTTIPCSECGTNCGKNHFNQPFNYNASSTFEKFQCDESFGEYKCTECASQCPFGVFYEEGSSYSGHFSRDFAVFGNEVEDNLSILNLTDENNTHQTPLDLELDTSRNETIIPDFTSNNSNHTTDDLERQAQQVIIKNVIEERKVFLPFGCTYRETKLFYEQEADGILGLGINTNTDVSPPNLLDALNLQNQSVSKAFSLCLAQQGGYFSVGGYNHAYHVPGEIVQFANYFTEYGQFRVVINKIEVGGKDIDLNMTVLNTGKGAFLDSGTTLTYLPTQTYNAITNALKSFCSENSTNCANRKQGEKLCWGYDKTEFPTQAEFFATFPTLKFHFGQNGTAEYNWQPEDYLYEKETGEYCIGISDYNHATILGATFMKNHDVLFDKENKRVGMVRANCSAVMNVTTPLYVTNQLLSSQEEPNQEPIQESVQEPDREPAEETPRDPPQQPVQEPIHEVVQEESIIKELGQATNFVPTEMTQISHPSNPDYWRILLLSLGIVAASAVIGIGIFYWIRYYKRKTLYDDMSSEVELPSRRGTGKSADTSMEHHASTLQAQPSESVLDVQIPVPALSKMVISVSTD